MINNPAVSVLITVYNDEKNISLAIKSIQEQTFQDFEIVVINDGSTDNTQLIVEKIQNIDNRIVLINQNNQGTTKAANNGLQICKGKYIARLDSDDFSYPHRLQFEFNYLESHPNVVLIGGGSHIVDKDGNIIGQRNIKTTNPAKTLFHRCIFQQSDVMYRKNAVLSIGGYREKFKNAQDYDLWLRLSAIGEIAKVQEIFGVWRLNPGGYTLSRKIEQRKEIKLIKKMAFLRKQNINDGYDKYLPNNPVIAHRNDISDDDYNFWIVQSLLKDGRKKEARSLIFSKFNNNMLIKKYILLVVTYFPDFILTSINKIREFYLNNIQ